MGYEYYINDTDNWHLDKDILGDENDMMYSAEYVKARQAQVNVLKEKYKGMVDDRVWDGLMRDVFCK